MVVMTWRIALVLLQALGAISIVPYPAILVANIMSIAGEGPGGIRRVKMTSPFVLLSFYPLVWLGLYKWSWRAIGRDEPALAIVLSTVPIVLSLCGAAAWILSERPQRKRERAQAETVRAAVEAANPLVWTMLCAGGSRQLAGLPHVSIESALRVIREAPDVRTQAPEYGTPLHAALRNLSIRIDGTPADRNQKDLIRLVRALLARGAQLSADESKDMRNSWALKVALLEGPSDTQSVNPLTWRILKRPDPAAPLSLRDGERPLVNRPTLWHGTPLYAAMLRSAKALGPLRELIEAGARLTQEEERDPAPMSVLVDVFREFPHLCDVYLPPDS